MLGCRAVLGLGDLPPLRPTDGGSDRSDGSIDASRFDARPEDAGTQDARRPGLDANADGDGRSTVDAGQDSPSFCDTVTPTPAFCADFDRAKLEEGWYNATMTPDPGVMGGGTITGDTTLSVSKPRSVQFTIPALVTGSDSASAFLVTTLPSVPQYALVQFDLRIDTERIPPDGGGAGYIMSLDFGASIGAVDIVTDALGWRLDVVDRTTVPATEKRARFAETPAVGQWVTVSLLLHNYPDDDGGPDGTLHAIVNGLGAVLPIPVGFQTSATLPNLDIGPVIAVGPMEMLQLNVDNVVVTFYTLQ